MARFFAFQGYDASSESPRVRWGGEGREDNSFSKIHVCHTGCRSAFFGPPSFCAPSKKANLGARFLLGYLSGAGSHHLAPRF